MPSTKSISRSINTAARRTKNRLRDALSTIIPGVRPGSIDFEEEKATKIGNLMKEKIATFIPLKGGKKSKTQKRRKNHRRTYKK